MKRDATIYMAISNQTADVMRRNISTVEVIIEYKRALGDPEGETIRKHLTLKGGYPMITEIRAGKILKMKVQAEGEEAVNLVKKACEELRIYNPAAQVCEVRPESDKHWAQSQLSNSQEATAT